MLAVDMAPPAEESSSVREEGQRFRPNSLAFATDILFRIESRPLRLLDPDR